MAKPPENETPEHKKQRQREARRQARQRPFEDKESYRWVEALEQGTKRVQGSTKVIHIFDREGDISEVFEKVCHLERTGVVIRATHDRKLDAQSDHLWSKLQAQPIAFDQELELPATGKRAARTARIAVRLCAVNLRTPTRFEDCSPLAGYAVYAQEVDAPEGETPLSWMLLTTEAVHSIEDAARILRWYSFRWRIEEYHKFLKSGTQVERYRLGD
ncbi:MAG TPA: IS4 family transposase [Stenomitos sp.]